MRELTKLCGGTADGEMARHALRSRQKSCDACVRSKRRCNKQTPVCSQCAKKKLVCVYGNRSNTHGPSTDRATTRTRLESPLESYQHHDTQPDPLDFIDPAKLDMASTSQDLQAVFSLERFLQLVPEDDLWNEFWLDGSFVRHIHQDPDQSDMILTAKDYSRMAHICDHYEPWQLSDPDTEAAFGISYMKDLITQFATSGSTPFIHEYLYRRQNNPWINQVFSACVLYTHVNKTNRGITLRVLHDNVKNLFDSANGANLTPQQKIARAHALMLYQLIRMFDGDITLGAQVDTDMATLGLWLEELRMIRDNLKKESDMAEAILRDRPPESWERWIFAESVRRTCIFGYAQIFFWNLLKSRVNPNDAGIWACVHRWTLSSHLWNAKDSFDFLKAWQNKPFFIISGLDFHRFLQYGTGQDVDGFARFFLTVYFGVSEMKAFCARTADAGQPTGPTSNMTPK